MPALSESAGFPFVSRAWFVLMVPAGTPEPVVARYRQDIAKVVGTDDFGTKYLEPNGWEAFSMYGNELGGFIAADRKEYETRVAPLGLQLE